MSETTKTFTPEQRLAFEEKYNLWVYSHEAMIELLMQQDKRIHQLEERLMEVAKNIKPVTDFINWEPYISGWSLADKWK